MFYWIFLAISFESVMFKYISVCPNLCNESILNILLELWVNRKYLTSPFYSWTWPIWPTSKMATFWLVPKAYMVYGHVFLPSTPIKYCPFLASSYSTWLVLDWATWFPGEGYSVSLMYNFTQSLLLSETSIKREPSWIWWYEKSWMEPSSIKEGIPLYYCN